MNSARALREAERERYFDAHRATLPDIKRRWRNYENLILTKFGPKGYRAATKVTLYRRRADEVRMQALDYAWERRDRYHEWVANGKNEYTPRSKHYRGSDELAAE